MSHGRNPMTSEMVVSKLYETVDSIRRERGDLLSWSGLLDAQRLEQWLGVLRRRPALEAFEALIGVFCNTHRPDTRFIDQEYAGRLLLSLNPPNPPDIQAVIKRTLPTWDLSVEQLPMYFEAAMGREAVLQALDMLGSKCPSEQEQRAIETFRFWLRARRDT
jgi:hypothetical protein